MINKGCKYGTHRVVSPAGVLPQAAYELSNDMEAAYSNEIIVDVSSLNIDSASFAQIKAECGGETSKIGERILDIVSERGKMQNPVTGSGGMFIGTVRHVGQDLTACPVKPGDRIASLVSLSLTPLNIDSITAIHPDIDRVDIIGQAVLFESGIYAKLPDDMTAELALAALDVAGAPAQAAKLVKPCQSVLILGAGGKSGMLCCYEATKRVGPTGRVVAMLRNKEQGRFILENGLAHEVIYSDAAKPIDVLEKALEANHGGEYDLSISCVNVPDTEMSCILPVKDGGTVYFFSMATSFTRAALGAEGIGKDINMVIGNGYTRDHAEITLNILRECAALRSYFESKYL